MTETTPGREPIQIVEIVQPLCANTFSVSPCTATAATGGECFNTRSTCQDPANFDGSSSLSLFFSRGYVAERGVSGAPYIIPSLVSVSTIPAKINLAVTDRDSAGLGRRAVATVTFQDHPHTDRRVDPYVSTRTYEPMERGSFWTKWLARNVYRYNIVLNVYEGYAGQALGAMIKRTYTITDISGPTESGRVTVKAKDFLSKVEERKAQIPKATPGLLSTDISATRTTISVVNAGTGDYPAASYIRIGDEIMAYSSVQAGVNNTIVFNISERGAFDTVAASHSKDDSVQEVAVYSANSIKFALEDLLIKWAGIDAAYVDSAGTFTTEGAYFSFSTISAQISDPVSVFKVISQLQQQFGFYLWWDERDALIKMQSVRGLSRDDATPKRLTDSNAFIESTFSISDMPDRRISQVWYYYELRSPIANADEPTSYKELLINADLTSEGDDQYGEASIKKIPARFVNRRGTALSTGSRTIVRYRDVPRRAKFRLDAKDRALWLADTVEISHFLDVDQFGERNETNWLITSSEEVVPGEVVEYEADDITLAGVVVEVQANGSPDYAPGASQFDAFIGDSDGLLSDGTRAGEINA